jgi:type II secretory pathway component GspD/PulD (secretin)
MQKNIFILVLVCFSFFVLFETGAYYSRKDAQGQYLISQIKEDISLDLEGASLIDVLKVLSQQTGLNFVASAGVRDRSITLYLDQVPLKKALDTVFLAYNLGYEFYPESNIFIVRELGAPSVELETRVYGLKHARLTSTRLDIEIGEAIGGKGEGGIQDAVKDVLSSQGKVVGDPRTNSLIITDFPAQFKHIEPVLKALDVAIPKILIEVEMLNVSKRVADNLGLDWSDGFQLNFGSTYGRSFNNTFRFWSNNRGKTGTTSTTLNLDGVLELLHEETDTKVLARPKILTMSGETAEIKLTTDEVIALEFTFDSDGNISDAKPERAETGTSLRVTPIVSSEGQEITLYFEPVHKDAETSGFVYGNTEYKNVNERSVKSAISLRDGETFVIGGLLANESSLTTTKVPFLGDLPLIGGLFRHQSRDSSRNKREELLVFLTPHIIDDGFDSIISDTGEFLTERREQGSRSKRESINKALASFE